jgi:hypothetical protein
MMPSGKWAAAKPDTICAAWAEPDRQNKRFIMLTDGWDDDA